MEFIVAVKKEMDYKLVGFVYSILVRCVLKKAEVKQCEEGKAVPSDFCDDNMLLAESFVWLGYAKSIDEVATDTDEFIQAWNDGFSYAVKNKYFPWKFYHSELEETIDIVRFNKGDSFRIQEWEHIHQMKVGDVFNEVMTRTE